MEKVYFELTNCMDCPHHKVERDPDPDDWFCDDDEKVMCLKSNVSEDENKPRYRNITVACRPHQKRQECEIPNWCPLKS